MHVLVIEDDRKMAQLLKHGLEEENQRVTLAGDGRSGFEFAREFNFDVIVLDVMLPGMDGFQVARELRAQRVQTPMLMLTARDAVPDITTGLDAGADDYLTKPFAFAVLLARIRALARRGPATLSNVLRVADLSLDPGRHFVQRGSSEIKLTATEFRLLELLMRNAGRAVSRSTILMSVWGFEEDVEDNTLDAFVSSLRGKIHDKKTRPLIHTIRGFGYCMREASQ
jgi:DNA-binding response OmpR family regulator